MTPSIATKFQYVNSLLFSLFYSLHVSAPTGHPQVRYTIRYLKNYFLIQQIRCTYAIWYRHVICCTSVLQLVVLHYILRTESWENHFVTFTIAPTGAKYLRPLPHLASRSGHQCSDLEPLSIQYLAFLSEDCLNSSQNVRSLICSHITSNSFRMVSVARKEYYNVSWYEVNSVNKDTSAIVS
jgi:hypothetical protein